MINRNYLDNFRPITEDGLYGTMLWKGTDPAKEGVDHTFTFTVDVKLAIAYIVVSDHHIDLRSGIVLVPSGLSMRIVHPPPEYDTTSLVHACTRTSYAGEMVVSQKATDSTIVYDNFITSLVKLRKLYGIKHFHIISAAIVANWAVAQHHTPEYQPTWFLDFLSWASPIGLRKDEDQQLRADGILFVTRDCSTR